MKKCPKCGAEGESKYCPNCGSEMEGVVEVVEPKTKARNKKKKKIDIKIVIIIVLLLSLIVVLFASVEIIRMQEGTMTDSEYNEVDLIEAQNKTLHGGTYVIGDDFPAGKYTIQYSTTMSEDDYWSGDYLWIIRAGSEGTNETLGGDKFDERYGDVVYEDATKGKSFYVRLQRGDTMRVDSDYGSWMY